MSVTDTINYLLKMTIAATETNNYLLNMTIAVTDTINYLQKMTISTMMTRATRHQNTTRSDYSHNTKANKISLNTMKLSTKR